MFNKGMKPPISYYGGKQRIASKIIDLIPKHTVYVEPFAGGAAVFFAKPWPDVTNQHHYREVLNDKDGSLINFYEQLKNNGEELIRRLELTLYSEQKYRESKTLVSDDKIEAACRYFTNINQSFCNVIGGGWGRGTYGRNFAGTWMNRVERLPDYVHRMRSVHIACDDALKIIKQWDSPQTFFYCDPPYPNTDQGHYDGYTVNDLQNLVDILNQCEGSFILSNYNQEEVSIPDDWEFYQIQAVVTAGKRVKGENFKEDRERRRKEIVWRRASKVPPRDEIVKLFDSGKFDCFKG